MGYQVEMPKYKCHKEVRAAKITGYAEFNSKNRTAVLFFGDIGGRAEVTAAWMEKHKPEEGGYFVIYEDGYTSFSPAEAFEGGYSRF